MDGQAGRNEQGHVTLMDTYNIPRAPPLSRAPPRARHVETLKNALLFLPSQKMSDQPSSHPNKQARRLTPEEMSAALEAAMRSTFGTGAAAAAPAAR